MESSVYANSAINILMIVLEANHYKQFAASFKSVIAQYFSDIQFNINQGNFAKKIFLSSHFVNNMKQQKQRLVTLWKANRQKIVSFVNQHLFTPTGQSTPNRVLRQLTSAIELILNSYPRERQYEHLILWIKAKISDSRQELMSLKDRCIKIMQKNPQSEQYAFLAMDILIQLQRYGQAQAIATKRLRYLQAMPAINKYVVSEYYLYKYFILCKFKRVPRDYHLQCIDQAFTLCKKNKSVNDYLIIQIVFHRFLQAKKVIIQITQQTGDELYFLPALAFLSLQALDMEEAKKYLQKITDILKQQSPQVFYQYAFFMNAIGFITFPCQILPNTSPLEIDNGYFEQMSARILYRRQQYAAALPLFAKCKLYFFDLVDPKIMIALCLVGLQRKEEAKDYMIKLKMDDFCTHEIVIMAQIYIQLGMTNESKLAILFITKQKSLYSFASLRLGYFKLKNSKFISWQKESKNDVVMLLSEVIQSQAQKNPVHLFQLYPIFFQLRFLIHYCFDNNQFMIGKTFVKALGDILQQFEDISFKGAQLLRERLSYSDRSARKHHIQV